MLFILIYSFLFQKKNIIWVFVSCFLTPVFIRKEIGGLAKFFTSVSPAFDKYQHPPANSIHTSWLCPQLSNYWSKVFAIFLDIYGMKPELDPLTALFLTYVAVVCYSYQYLFFLTFNFFVELSLSDISTAGSTDTWGKLFFSPLSVCMDCGKRFT